MDCPVEENDIRSILAGIPGIKSLHFRLAERKLGIEAGEGTIQECLSAIRRSGYQADIVTSGKSADTQEPDEDTWKMWTALAIACIVEVIELFFSDISPYFIFDFGSMGLSLVAIVLAGFQTYRKGIAALLRLKLNINALMAVAVTGAFLIGEWSEAAMVMALFSVSEWLERKAAIRADNAIKQLLDLTPDTAEVLDHGQWEQHAVKDIPVNALVRVRPGQRIPLDGIVQDGNSLVDQSAVTGESIPVSKQNGDLVLAGTVNQNGILHVKVTSSASETVAARIIRTVEEAREAKAPFAQFIDRFAAIYTPMVFVIASVIALGCPFLMGMTWLQSCYRALAILVIACPCALVISTPVTLVSGLAAAARKGILIKGGVFLEHARKIRLLALDKTGTVTEGKPKLQHYHILTDRYPESDILAWASVLSSHSDHPVSKAITKGLPDTDTVCGCGDFVEIPGKGISAIVDGQLLRLGNVAWISEINGLDDTVSKHLHSAMEKGYTIALLATDAGVLAVFAIADIIKSTSRNAVNLLNKLGIEAVLLTGDNIKTAQAIAHEAGIAEVRAQLLPTEKSQAVLNLKSRNAKGLVAMAGDGINDAPALVTADIGIAMGQTGTDIAMEAADVVIMNDDLGNIPEFIQLSKDTFSILIQNISFALVVKFIFIALALMGMATMWMAVFADIGTTLIVLFNGLRMLRK
ncbi:MAG: cadmium-translocating P-type ATPase [Oxalobacter sp.]|nr:cadmium-translocating P-type ATPase [Oxalobacter sp.]